MINLSYPNGDESLAQEADFPDQDSQYTPTPGYYEQTPPSDYGFSTSPARCPQDRPESFTSPKPGIPKLLQLFEWEASSPDDELHGNVVRYIIEWKVKVKTSSLTVVFYHFFRSSVCTVSRCVAYVICLRIDIVLE
jgi:hypothetical protein